MQKVCATSAITREVDPVGLQLYVITLSGITMYVVFVFSAIMKSITKDLEPTLTIEL